MASVKRDYKLVSLILAFLVQLMAGTWFMAEVVGKQKLLERHLDTPAHGRVRTDLELLRHDILHLEKSLRELRREVNGNK